MKTLKVTGDENCQVVKLSGKKNQWSLQPCKCDIWYRWTVAGYSLTGSTETPEGAELIKLV